MKSCMLGDFFSGLAPWLDRDHVRRAYLDRRGNFVIQFLDGVRNVCRMDHCSGAQIRPLLKSLKKKGIPFSG